MPDAAISVAKKAKSAPCAASAPSAAATSAARLLEQRGLVGVAALGRQPGGVGEQQPARLHHGAHHLVVERRAAAERVHEHVEPAVGAPVAHPHRVALADVHELELLEALDALAHRGHVHAERGRQRALGREPLAGGVAAGEHVGGEAVEDLVGQRRSVQAVFHCSEQ